MRSSIRFPRELCFPSFVHISQRGQQSALGISRCVYQPPEDYLDILVAAGGGQASHLIHATQHRCSNCEGEGVKNGWRGGGIAKRDREVEGGGAVELAATSRSTSIMGTLQTAAAFWRWRGPVQSANPPV